jgi:hypothetical protein
MLTSVVVESTIGDSAIESRQRLGRVLWLTADAFHARPYLVAAKTRDKISDPMSKDIGNRNDEVTTPDLAALVRCYTETTVDPRYREHPIELGRSEGFYGKGCEDCDRRLREVLGWVP